METILIFAKNKLNLDLGAQQFILDTKNATIQCTKILELIKRT